MLKVTKLSFHFNLLTLWRASKVLTPYKARR
jgi:hypothetical protein